MCRGVGGSLDRTDCLHYNNSVGTVVIGKTFSAMQCTSGPLRKCYFLDVHYSEFHGKAGFNHDWDGPILNTTNTKHFCC